MTIRDHKLSEYLTGLIKSDGYSAACETVEDWLDVLAELAKAGVDTYQIKLSVELAARNLKLKTGRVQ
jgi:hypothetical protein